MTPAGSDANPCTLVLPCSTFGRAYRVAMPGQTVQVASGNYPYQRLALDTSKTSTAHVVFEPAPGAVVSVDMLDFGQQQESIASPRHVTVRNMAVGYLRAWDGTSDVVWENIKGKTFDVFSSDNVRILGGDFGPCQTPAYSPCTPRLIGTNNVIDGAAIHDVTSTNLTDYHVDGLFIRGCRGCTVRRTKFWGNMITNIRVQDCCQQPQTQNLTLENNWFASPLQGDGRSIRADAVDIDNPVPGLLIRNNSFSESSGPAFGSGSFAGTRTRVVGNLMMNFPCVDGVTYSYNLFIPFNSEGWGSSPCSRSDRKVSRFGYVDARGFDYHLADGSPAIRAGAPGDCPSDDIDGQGRPNPCSTGSDER